LVVAGWRPTLTGECPDNQPSEITSIRLIISDLGVDEPIACQTQ